MAEVGGGFSSCQVWRCRRRWEGEGRYCHQEKAGNRKPWARVSGPDRHGVGPKGQAQRYCRYTPATLYPTFFIIDNELFDYKSIVLLYLNNSFPERCHGRSADSIPG